MDKIVLLILYLIVGIDCVILETAQVSTNNSVNSLSFPGMLWHIIIWPILVVVDILYVYMEKAV